jgi:hypothetical protein
MYARKWPLPLCVYSVDMAFAASIISEIGFFPISLFPGRLLYALLPSLRWGPSWKNNK